MASLLNNAKALLAGINYHMRRLNNQAFDSDLDSDSDSDSDSDLDSERMIEPRDLFFNVNTIQKTVENDKKARFRDAARRLMPRRRGGRCSAYKMHPGCFAEKFNCDFTKILIDRQLFARGGADYIRPLGSMRYALDVLDKYGDNAWLGYVERPIECGSLHGEWPVAYHGTTDPRAASIVASGGLDLHDGKSYKLIVQARVDPSHREIVPKSQHGIAGLDDYWIIKKNDAIRPYGICVFPC
ncbi:unnamed protein product, partial [Mesorhabditis belari]|uniref:Uncharacterized protein n=1 Tax=Mesorhabditis belari TaxID=2138241 RepID=A0AAF3J8P3_9BILA